MRFTQSLTAGNWFEESILPSSANAGLLKTETGVAEGVGIGGAIGPLADATILPTMDGARLVAWVRGARVTAIVPMNKMANTATPIIHFQKFGFLVTGVSS